MIKLSWTDRLYLWAFTKMVNCLDKKLADPTFAGNRNEGIAIRNKCLHAIKGIKEGTEWWDD